MDMDNEVRNEVAETQQTTAVVDNGKKIDLCAGDYAIIALAAYGGFRILKWGIGKAKDGIGKFRDKKAKKPATATVVEGSAEVVDDEQDYTEE